MSDPERKIEMDEDFNDFLIESIDASLVNYSPSHQTNMPSSPQPWYFNENPILYDNMDSFICHSPSRRFPSPEPCLIYRSPSHWFPSPEASLINYSPSFDPPSPKPGFSQRIFSYGNFSVFRKLGLSFQQVGRLLKNLLKFSKLLKHLEELDFVQELDRLQIKNRVLLQFFQHASRINLCAPEAEIYEEGHDRVTIKILDKMILEDDTVRLQLSWTKAPGRHRSLANGGDLKKSCTSIDGCHMHQDCMSTAHPEIYYEYWTRRLRGEFSSHSPLVHSASEIGLKRVLANCETVASADDQPDSRCELTHGEEMLQQDSVKHQLVGETHATNDGENVLSEDGIHSAVAYPENEGTRKTLKRKITLEDLQHFSGSRKDAVKHFKVSESTIKRCLRDHKIKDWRNRTTDKNNQCLSEPKDIIESLQGEGAEMENQMAGGSRSCEKELNHEQIGFPLESEKGSDRSQIGVGLMEEMSTQMESTPVGDMFVSSTHEQCIESGDYSNLPVQPSELNLSAARLMPDVVNSTPSQIPEGELLIENSRSSRELSDHYISATEAFNAKQVPDSSRINLSCSDPAPKQAKATAALMMPLVKKTQDTRTVTMKATYREDMIRFQLSLTSGIMELRNEVAERVMLEVGTFNIKYLDDDEHWILITCDKDLQECFKISVSLGLKFIPLSIHDITPR